MGGRDGGHQGTQKSLAFINIKKKIEGGDRLRLCFEKISLAEYRYKGAMLEARMPTGRLEQGRCSRRGWLENCLGQRFSFSLDCNP